MRVRLSHIFKFIIKYQENFNINETNPLGILDDSKNPIIKTSNGGLRLCGSTTWECVFNMIKYDI